MQIGGDNFILDDDLHQKIKTFPFLIKTEEIKINFPKWDKITKIKAGGDHAIIKSTKRKSWPSRRIIYQNFELHRLSYISKENLSTPLLSLMVQTI